MCGREAMAIRKMRTNNLLRTWLEDAKGWGQGDTYLGKRRHPRYRWRVAVDVEVVSVGGETYTASALTRDISEGGIGLECRRAIELHSTIRIRMMGEPYGVEGVVVHSGECMGVHIVGVALTSCDDPGVASSPRFPRSASMYTPRVA